MPENLRRKLLRALSKTPRLHNRTYEKRAVIDGVLIYGTGKSPEICEENFISSLLSNFTALQNPEKKNIEQTPSKNVSFAEWADIWFTRIYHSTVLEYTYERQYKVYRKHILPFFGTTMLKEISFLDCSEFFNEMRAKNIERTAESCYGILSRIFASAFEDELIRRNPMAKIKPVKHERKNGTPLSKEEERIFLENIRGSKYEALLLVSLYTGLRPCELPSARIEGSFIVSRNRKQKNTKKIVFKKIPITPMLEPYRTILENDLPKLTENFSLNAYRTIFNRAIQNHRLYDLRDTFATRCQECGVPENVVQLWMGHTPGTLLGNVYTRFSDEYLLSEGKKVKY